MTEIKLEIDKAGEYDYEEDENIMTYKIPDYYQILLNEISIIKQQKCFI